MTPPGSRRNFFTSSGGSPFDFPEVPRSLARLRPALEVPVASRNAGLFRQDEALRRLLTLGYPRLGPTAEGPRTPADMEAAVRALWDSGRQGNRLGYLDAMRGCYVLLHRQMGDAGARAEIPRLARLFSDIAEEYARHIAERPEYSPLQRLTYLFAAARVARLFLGRLGDAEAGSTPEFAGEIAALRGLLQRFHVTLEGYVGEAQRAEPGNLALQGIRLQIEMRQFVLQGENDRARLRARELAAFYREHPPLEENEANPESLRFYHAAGRELGADPDFLNLIGQLDGPSQAEQEGGILNGVALQWLATAAGTLDQVNEDSEATIRSRYQALSAVTTVLALAYPAATLRSLLAMLRDGPSAEDHRAALLRIAAASPEVATYLREVAGEESLEDLWRRAVGAASHVESLREGPGRRTLEAVLSGSEAQHPVAQLAGELARHPGLLVALDLEADGGPGPSRMNNALELLRRGEEGLRQVRAFAEAHPDVSYSRLLRLLEPAEGANVPANAFAERLLEVLQEDLGSHEDHEEAMAQALFQSVAQSGEIAPERMLSPAVANQARSLAQRMEGMGYRGYRVLRHLVAPQSLATLGLGILATELTPALLIARAGASGRLAAPLIGDLVRAGTLSRRGTFLTGLGSGVGMAALGTGLHSLHRHGLGLRTHFWRDFGTSGVINGLTFGSTLLFARGWNRLLSPNAANGVAIGEIGLARGLALHGGNAVFGTFMGMGLGIVARRLQNGRWETSWDEVAENFATMLLWETGAAGLRGLRRSAGLNAELYLPEAGRFARIWNRLPLLRNPSVLGEHRALRTGVVADRMIQANPSLAGDRPFLLRQLGLHEAHAPGSLESFNDAMFQHYEPRISGAGRQRRLLMVRRASPVPAEAPDAGGNSPDVRQRRNAILDPQAADPSAPAAEAQDSALPPRPAAAGDVDEAAQTPPRGVPAMPAEPLTPLPPAEGVLEPGLPLMVIEGNEVLTRRGEHFLAAPGLGEVAAFTHEGVSKQIPPRNEDAYGLLRLGDGSLVALAFDGAGGSGAGDLASSLGIQTVMARMLPAPVTLGEAFLAAHQTIQQHGHGGYTVATGIRVHPSGHVEVATVGDTQLLVARPRGDGGYEVIRPYFPHNLPGVIRASGHEIANTLEMNAHPGASRVFGALGSHNMTVTTALARTPSGNFHPQGIYNAPLTLPERPDGGGAHRPFQARPGDVFLMMSDGVHELFTREQMGEVMRGLRGAGEIRDALQREIEARLEVFRISRGITSADGARLQISFGRFQGHFVDAEGDVYPAATGGARIGHVSPDNVVLVALRYDPAVRAPEPASPPTGPDGSGSPRTASEATPETSPVAAPVAPTEEAADLQPLAAPAPEEVPVGSPEDTENTQPLVPPGAGAESEVPAALAVPDTWAATLGDALLPDVMARVQVGVRDRLIQAAQGRAHRDSPFVAQFNTVHVEIAIDPSTGEVVPAEHADPRRHVLRTRILAEADRNVILLDNDSIDAFQREMGSWGLSEEDGARVGSVLQALRGLHGQAIVPRETIPATPAALAASTGEGTVEVLPGVPRAFVASMRAGLRHLLGNLREGAMTSMMGGGLRWVTDPAGFYVGDLTLGPNGEILAANLGLPDFLSPRGTRYRSGVALGGERVEVVVARDGTLLHAEPHEGLNERQQAALIAYRLSPENREGLARLQAEQPYALEMIQDRGVGRLIHPIGRLLDAHLCGISDGRSDESIVTVYFGRGPEGYELSETPFEGGVAVELSWRSDSPMRGQFDYRLVSGEIPAELHEVLEHLRARTAGVREETAGAEAPSPVVPPAYPENRPTLFTFAMNALWEIDLGNPRSFGALLRDSGRSDLISRVGGLREATLRIHPGGAPWSYELTSPATALIVHLNWDPTPLVVPRGGSQRVEIRPGDSMNVSDFLPGENRLGEHSLTFLHHRRDSQE